MSQISHLDTKLTIAHRGFLAQCQGSQEDAGKHAFAILSQMSKYCKSQKKSYLKNEVDQKINETCLDHFLEFHKFLRDLQEYLPYWIEGDKIETVSSDLADLHKQQQGIQARLIVYSRFLAKYSPPKDLTHPRLQVEYEVIALEIGDLLEKFAKGLGILAKAASSYKN